jgi:hypothetical protein
MAVITTGSHPKALWPGVRQWFGAVYKKQPKKWSQIFETVVSDKAYEDDVAMTSFGLAGKKPEGQPLVYDSHSQEWTRRHTHDTYALGYVVTEEEMEDNLYEDRSFKRSQLLAVSMGETKEINAANVFNRGFDSTYPGGDGVCLFSAAHPTGAGTQSNLLATSADFSEAALEDMLIMMQDNRNSRGLRFPLQGMQLVIRHEQMFEVERVLNSVLRPGTPNNDTNVLRSPGILPQGYVVCHHLSSPDAWFVKSNAPNGLLHFQRRALRFQQDNDFDTANAKAKASERYVFDWTDWRGVYGSAGA